MRSFFLGTMLGLLGVAFIGCTDGVVSQEPLGKLSANVVVAPGEDITEMNYEITGNGVDLTGTIPVTSNPVTATIAGIPVGTRYTITLTSPDGKCSGSTTFDSIENQTSDATVAITCPNPRGNVSITGTFTACTTTITSVVASPALVNVGGTISVNAATKDTGGLTPTYAWSATAGSFADASAAKTTYTCSVAGSQTLTIKASNGTCNDSFSFKVSCGGGLCGNGTLDAGETCDTTIAAGNTGACPTSCTPSTDPCKTVTLQGTLCQTACVTTTITVPVCGDGCVTSPETCEPPNTATCDTNCKTKTCGNGVLDSGEKCDTAIPAGSANACPTSCTPGTDACNPVTLQGSGCQAECKAKPVTVAVCGDRCVTSPETCDDGNTVSGDGCSSTCTIEATCGNGKLDTGEKCDTAIPAGSANACPTSCTPGTDACNPVKLQGTLCQAACVATPVTTAVCGDGCVSGTEQCEPPNTTTCDANCQNIVCADITGTWILHLNTTGTITQGTVVIPNVNIDYIIRLYNRKESGNLVSTIQICELAAGATGLVTSYSDAVIKTFTVSGSKPDFCAKVAKPVTFPTFQILSGTKSATLPTGTTSPCSSDPSSTCDAAPDTDGDGKYGITLTTTLGVLTITTYTGLVLTISLNDMVLDDATTMSGTTSFTSNGFVWGTSLLGFGVGPVIIALDSNAIPIESFLLPGHGEVLCPQVVTHCTTGPTGVCTP